MGSRSVACMMAMLALSPGMARAQARLSLAWEAPASCPDGAAVEGEVARLLGGGIPSEGAPIVAEARAAPTESGYALTLRTEVGGARGERALRGERCEELAAAAALILALMIDPVAVARADPVPSPLAAASAPAGPPAEPTPEPPSLAQGLSSPTAQAPPAPPHPGPPPAPAPAGPAIRAILGAGALLDVGTLPSATVGALVEAGLGVPAVDGRVRAVFLFPQSAQNPAELPGGSADLMGLSLGLVGCVRPIDVARFAGVCAEVAGGTLFGSASGISDPNFGAGFWLAAGGGVSLAWQPAPWFDVEAMAEVLGQIVAPSFVVTVVEEGDRREVTLFAPGGVTGRFGLRTHVQF